MVRLVEYILLTVYLTEFMTKFSNITKNDRQLKAITGLSIKEFEILLESFAKILHEFLSANKNRQREYSNY